MRPNFSPYDSTGSVRSLTGTGAPQSMAMSDGPTADASHRVRPCTRASVTNSAHPSTAVTPGRPGNGRATRTPTVCCVTTSKLGSELRVGLITQRANVSQNQPRGFIATE